MMKLQITVILLLVTGAFAQLIYLPYLTKSEDSTEVFVDTVWHEEQSWEDQSYSMFCAADSLWSFDIPVHFIAGPVDINCSTGEVVIAEGADISSASVKFWRSLEAAYPYLFEGGN